MALVIRRLDSGYYHVRGDGPCNWAQPPSWPCSEAVLRAHAFAEAGEAFLREACAAAERATVYEREDAEVRRRAEGGL